MKIALFLNKDLEANLAYNLLKAEFSNHSLRIYYSSSIGNTATKPLELLKLEYYEKEFFFDEVGRLIREYKVNSSFEFFDNDFKSYSLQPCTDVNSYEFIQEMKEFEPDLFLSIRFGKIFKNEIIKIPKYGLLNLHSALLPDYRGILGTLHALKDKRKRIGCTLHTIPTSGIDTGEIIEMEELEVNAGKSLFWHIVSLYPLGAKLIRKALGTLECKNPIQTEPQDLAEGTYFSIPTKSDFEEIKQLGFNTISSNDYLEVLSDFVLPTFPDNLKIQIENIFRVKNESD